MCNNCSKNRRLMKQRPLIESSLIVQRRKPLRLIVANQISEDSVFQHQEMLHTQQVDVITLAAIEINRCFPRRTPLHALYRFRQQLCRNKKLRRIRDRSKPVMSGREASVGRRREPFSAMPGLLSKRLSCAAHI